MKPEELLERLKNKRETARAESMYWKGIYDACNKTIRWVKKLKEDD